MKKIFVLLIVFCFHLFFGQSYNKEKLLTDYHQYDIVLKYDNDFNNDGITDILYILSSKKENDESLINNNDSVSKRKAVVYLGKNDKIFTKVLESDNIFPCRECLGKSDNFVSNLKFENNTLSYTTCIAPFASNNYSVINFNLQFSNNNFNIYKYEEVYYKVSEDDDATIILVNNDIPKLKFNYYEWTANKSWLDYIIISNQNITKLNDFAYNIESVNPSVAINLLRKILEKFPNRTVAYLNIADSYWAIGNQESAKENYKKYVSLMKSQNKDLKKISKQVWERVK